MLALVLKNTPPELVTAAAIGDWLSEAVIEDILRSYTVGILSQPDCLGIDNTRLVVGTIDAASAVDPLLKPVMLALSTVGIQLCGDDRRGMIALLADAGNWPDTLRDRVLALGRSTRTRWESLGGAGAPPSVEAIQAEIDVERLASRITNATALMRERLTITQTAEQQAAVVAQAWLDAGA